ncbi:MAG: hypothetical protein AB7L41_09870 [Flavobacteriaceae bacterium]
MGSTQPAPGPSEPPGCARAVREAERAVAELEAEFSDHTQMAVLELLMALAMDCGIGTGLRRDVLLIKVRLIADTAPTHRREELGAIAEMLYRALNDVADDHQLCTIMVVGAGVLSLVAGRDVLAVNGIRMDYAKALGQMVAGA